MGVDAKYGLGKREQEHLLYVRDGLWSAAWAGGLFNCVPGHGPRTAQQAVERYNRTLKEALPAGYHTFGLKHTVTNLANVMRSHLIHNRWVAEDESNVIFKASDPRSPSQHLISADWIKSGRDEEDQQRLLAPVWRHMEHLPDNFHCSECT